jgi:hypothetical protein
MLSPFQGEGKILRKALVTIVARGFLHFGYENSEELYSSRDLMGMIDCSSK